MHVGANAKPDHEMYRGLFFAMGVYVVGAHIVLPIMSPLRILEIADPAVVRQLLNPLVALLVILALGPAKAMQPIARLQYFLIFVFLQAAFVGVANIFREGEFRPYLSHLFQLISAYFVFAAGARAAMTLSVRFYRVTALVSLVSFTLSTLVTIWILGSQGVGRFYSPGYTLMPAFSYFLAFEPGLLLLLSAIGVMLSNKRGIIFATGIMSFAHYFYPLTQNFRKRFYIRFSMLALGALTIILATVVVLNVDRYDLENKPAIVRAAGITFFRLADVIVNEEEKDLDTISAGRLDEVETALETLTPVSVLIGNGAGWGVDLPYEAEKVVQNIHFSPLSFICVFGLPFCIGIYGYILFELFQAFFGRRLSGEKLLLQRMAALYVLGAALHSLTAYSMFVDMLFFFFLGVLRYLRKDAWQSGRQT